VITMAETASAVCLTEKCFWSASGPNSANAAIGHDVEFGDHNIWLTSGLVADARVTALGGNLGRWGRGETLDPGSPDAINEAGGELP
jgi:hypothetical protein